MRGEKYLRKQDDSLLSDHFLPCHVQSHERAETGNSNVVLFPVIGISRDFLFQIKVE